MVNAADWGYDVRINNTANCPTYARGRWELNAYVLPPFIGAGFLFNSLVIIVFIRLKYKHRSAFLLAALAVTDNLFLVVQFVLESLRYFIMAAKVGADRMERYSPWNIEPEIYIGAVIFYKAFLIVRNWLTVLIQVERLVTIYTPLKAGTILTTFRLKIIITVTALLSIGFGMYYPATLTFTDLEGYLCMQTEVDFYSDYHYVIFSKFNFLIDPLVRAIIPTVLVFLSNTLLLLILAVKMKQREEITNRSAAKLTESKATRMVVTMSVVFLIFEVPGCVSKISEYITGKRIEMSNTIYNITSVLNSCINFFLYYIVNSNFRVAANNFMTCRTKK